ncbi:MAG: hypothetical protein ABIT76_14475 [Chthoniobacterales bacterium]
MNYRALFLAAVLPGCLTLGAPSATAAGSATTAADPKLAAEKAMELARAAVAADPQNGRAHVALAIALGKMTDFTDNRTKLAYAREIKAEAEIGLRLDPTNVKACRILAQWHDSILRLNPVLKALAATLYGAFPEASAVDAEKYFRRATRLAPQSIATHGDLAAYLQRQDRASEAQLEWKKILALTAADAEDRRYLEEAKRMD